MGAFASTPTFELFRRGLEPRIIQKFRGINAYRSLAELGPQHAQDCLNVIAPGWGGLSKLRLPQPLSAVVGINTGPNQLFDFQQGNGTRQVFANLANSLYFYTWNGAGTALNAGVLIENAVADAPPWSFVEANNILFGANGTVMKKWLGALVTNLGTPGWQNTGIVAPVNPPVIGTGAASATVGFIIRTLQRDGAGNVTLTMWNGGPPHPGEDNFYFAVGDTITIFNPNDATMNGTFTIASEVTPGLVYKYAQTGAASGPHNDIALLGFTTTSGVLNGVTAVRLQNVVTYTFPNRVIGIILAGLTITVTGFADATFNGQFTTATVVVNLSGATSVTVYAVGNDGAAAGTGTVSFGVTITGSRNYQYSWFNQVTGQYSNVSPTATINGPLTNRIVYVGIPNNFGVFNPPDPQITGVQFFATTDGGGNYYADGPAAGIAIFDVFSDFALNKLIPAPLINNPPPVGKYLAVGQSRVFIANLVGAPNQIAYSGYEQILTGRPEESFPPNNRILLNIGAESINGIGVLTAGIVAFGATQRMYMLRGQVEDITLAAPIQFSAYLQELPWKIGTMSHDSIQATPYGLLFLGTDKVVRVFDGYSSLIDISQPVYPILQRMTKGTEAGCKSSYFMWLNLEIYAITFAIDGSLTNNYTLMWVYHKETQEWDIFPSNIPITSLTTLTTPQFQRILAIGNAGVISNLPASQDTVNGIATLNLIPATNGNLAAYWRSGYAGNDSPQRAEMWRWARFITDQNPAAYKVQFRLVDDVNNVITAPLVLGPYNLTSSRQGINQRGTRLAVEIDFPQQDVSSNVLEMQINSIPSSDR